MKHGMAGLGAYWCLVEIMYEQGGSLAWQDIPSIAYDLRIEEELINDIVSIGLFDDEGESITNARIVDVVDKTNKLSESRRKASRARWDKENEDTPVTPENPNAMQTECIDDASAMQMHSKCNAEKRREDKENIENNLLVTPSAPSVDLDALKELFNRLLVENNSIIAPIRAITGLRKTHTLARIREHGKETFLLMMKKAVASDFLNGKSDRGWVADFNWMIKPSNFIKIIEGNYDNRQNNGNRNNSVRNNPSNEGRPQESDFPSSL